MILLDRYLFWNFVKAWLALFVSLVSLYVVIDAFSHFDDLLQASRNLQKSITETMLSYYSYQLVLIFDRLCSVILLLAATFTIAWLQRQNELIPLLSAGVSTKRVLKPIYLGCLFFLTLQTINREVLIPQLAEHLEQSVDDPTGQRSKIISGGFDSCGILVHGSRAIPAEKIVRSISCTIPSQVSGTMYHLSAKEARFISAGSSLPDGSIRQHDGWLLYKDVVIEPDAKAIGDLVTQLNTGHYFVRVEQMNFRRITRNKSWYQYASLMDILTELDTSGAHQLPALATQFHQRLAAPLITLVTITLGMGIILRESSKNIFMNTAVCLFAAAGIFLLTMIGKYLGEREFISSAMAGWLPLIVFTPFAFTLRDSMQS